MRLPPPPGPVPRDSDLPESSPDRIAIGHDPRKRAVLDESLVLASQGVRHWIEFKPAPAEAGGSEFLLTVEPGDAPRAREILRRHELENRGYRPVDSPDVPPFDLHLSPLVYLAIPASVYFWTGSDLWEPWMTRQGGASAEKIAAGEWWRTLTATTLHADAEHFLGNMLSGFFIFNLLRRRCGPGTFMVLLTLAAMLTNWTVAAISPPQFFSLGFSTVVFAGLGMLAGLETIFLPRTARGASMRGLRNYTPLLGAFFLAVMVGLGEQSDIKGHFIGFAFGVLFSPAVPWLGNRGVESPGWQMLGVLGVAASYGAAWTLALR